MVWNTIVNQTQNFDPLYRGILRIGSTPKSSIVFFGLIFHDSYWGTQIYGNPNIPNGTMVIFHSYHSYLDVYPS